MEERTIKRENAMAAYNVASDETKKVLATLLGEDFCVAKDIKDRVKTFEDACRELGEKHPLVVQYNEIFDNFLDGAAENNSCDIVAYLKLRIITAALNEGWEPQFTKDEYRWYPWYNLYTQEEIDRMDEDEKKEVGLLLWGGSAASGSRCGLASAPSNYAWSLSFASVGSRLAFKSEELATYAGKQFIKIYANFCFKPENSQND